MAPTNLPTTRWGIVGTGLISSWFVTDLVLDRPDAKAKHVIQAIGSSSRAKGEAFVKQHIPDTNPTVHGNYTDLYNDPDVDVVYIGTPHAFHKAACLEAIAAGKHVLCEKAFTINTAEAQEVFDAARQKGVFVMEAMWTRFTPLLMAVQKMLHTDKVIGTVERVFCDFGLSMDIKSLGPESRLKNPELGAGSLLDIGIYSLTWGLLALDPNIADAAQSYDILASQSISDRVDIATTMILKSPSGSQAILTSTTSYKTADEFCRIEGTTGSIVVKGTASAPTTVILRGLNRGSAKGNTLHTGEDKDSSDKVYHFDKVGRGFQWEADAVALDIAAGRTQNATMPWAETIRVMKILDEVRRQGGARFPQDKDL